MDHDELVERTIAEFGEFKKVVRMTTGEAFNVPTRDIIEKGIREQDLDQYPRWEEAENESIEIDRWDVEDWAAHSRKGEVCGIFGCHGEPVERCSHCDNHYCEEHRWVIYGPGHKP